jgi:hypothetical protein
MITPSFALTATERVLPKLALDFTTASLDPRVTFTRTGNTATVVNSSGYLQAINANLPRFDYNPATLVCKGLLIEESRINSAVYSESITNWTVSNTTTGSDSTVNPYGVASGQYFADTAATAAFLILDAVTFVTATAYTFSVYAKAKGSSLIQLTFDRVGSGNYANFNLTTGVVTKVGGSSTATITNAGNGWYRCSVAATTVGGGSGSLKVYLLNNASSTQAPSYTGTGANSAYITCAQLEVGAFPTSYIPNTASTGTTTRNADVATMTGTNFSDWYTATTGAAVVWAIPQTATGTRPLAQFDDTTANEIIALRGNVADPELYIIDGGVAQTQIDVGTIVANTAYKLSGAWNINNCAAAKDGGSVGVDTNATIPTPTQLRIGSNGTNYACAWIQKIMYWPQRIINAEVQAFSK